MFRVGMLSGWHVHAKGYGNALKAMPDVAVTAVWDEEPGRGKAWADELGATFEADLDAFLGRDDVEGVVVDAPTNRHEEVMVAAARAHKHIFTEKVMALTVAECDRIADAVREAGVRFCISLPQRTAPDQRFAKKAIDEKLIGEVTFARVRVAHNGSSAGWLPSHFYDPVACGGGAMMDLGAHPMYLIRWLLGRPVRIASTFTYMTEHEVEDNAVSVIEFDSGAIGIAETSFVSTHSPSSIEVSGTEGSLFVGGPDGGVRIRSNQIGNDLEGWISPAQLPEALPAPIRLWVDGVLTGAPIPFGLEEGTQLTELMEYAYVSHREGRQIDIPPR